MNELWERILVGAEQIGNVLPALIGAAVILLTGYFLAVQIQRWADDTLKRVDFNRMASAGGLDQAVVRTGSRLDPVRALTKLLFWLIMLVVILLASTALGLESINEMFGLMLAFIPTLIAGAPARIVNVASLACATTCVTASPPRVPTSGAKSVLHDARQSCAVCASKLALMNNQSIMAGTVIKSSQADKAVRMAFKGEENRFWRSQPRGPRCNGGGPLTVDVGV